MVWFEKWCRKYWLRVVYGLGLAMLAVLCVQPEMPAERRLPFVLAVLLPLHVCEENTLPGGFHYMLNLTQRSEKPNAGPMNALTNMVSNFAAELLMIGLALYGGSPGISLMVAFFGFGETAAHLVIGVVVQKKLRSSGKKTIYGPGLATACLALLPLSVRAVLLLRGQTLTGRDMVTGVLLAIIVIAGLIRLPLMTLGKFQPQYAFSGSGYFARFQRPGGRADS